MQNFNKNILNRSLLHFTRHFFVSLIRLINNPTVIFVQFFWNSVGDMPVAFLKYLPKLDWLLKFNV